MQTTQLLAYVDGLNGHTQMDSNLMNKHSRIKKLLEPTYCESLKLQHENLSFTAGFCLSKLVLEDLKEKLSSFLHPKERSYFDTLQYPKRQYSYLLGRYCAKQALFSFFKTICPTEVLVENGVLQQPIIYYPACDNLTHSNLQVSISHTETLGAALIFPEAHPMAIDVETLDNNKNDIILSQLTKNEQELTFALSDNYVNSASQLSVEFPSIQMFWTIKEALSKVIKCGLTVPFELLEVESTIQKGNYYISQFKNFHQYQALSFLLPENICSLVYPKKTEPGINISAIQDLMGEFNLS